MARWLFALAAAAAVGAVLSLARGSAAPAASPAGDTWKLKTKRALLDLREPDRPFSYFTGPTHEPSLLAVADSALALRLSGARPPAGTNALLLSFWRPKLGLFEDPPFRRADLSTTRLAVSALHANRGLLGARRRATLLRALRWRGRAPGGFARNPDARQPDRVSTGEALTLLAELRREWPARDRARVEGMRAVAGRASSCGVPRRSERDWLARLAGKLLVAREAGYPCAPLAPRVVVRIRAILRSETARLRRIRRVGLGDLLSLRTLSAFERLGVLRRGAVRPAARIVARAVHGGSRGDKLFGRGGLPAIIRIAVEGVRESGVRATLRAGARFALARRIRWRGTLPDAVLHPSTLDAWPGFHALELLQPGLGARLFSAKDVRWSSPRLSAANVVELKLALDPRLISAADVRALSRSQDVDSSLGALGLLAVAAAARPEACDFARPQLTRALDLLRTPPGIEGAATALALLPIAMIFRGVDACVAREEAQAHGIAELIAAARTRLGALRVPGGGGVFAPVPGATPHVLTTWLGLETTCLLGDPLATSLPAARSLISENALATGGAWIESVDDRGVRRRELDVYATYAALRLERLAAQGCSPPWWAGIAAAGRRGV